MYYTVNRHAQFQCAYSSPDFFNRYESSILTSMSNEGTIEEKKISNKNGNTLTNKSKRSPRRYRHDIINLLTTRTAFVFKTLSDWISLIVAYFDILTGDMTHKSLSSVTYPLNQSSITLQKSLPCYIQRDK